MRKPRRNIDPRVANRFEKFAKMRLAGRSDIIYRNYDLLTPKKIPGDVKLWLYAAGEEVGYTGELSLLMRLKARFASWGYHDCELDWITQLLHEFWVYQRIANKGLVDWPHRTPEEIKRLHAENEANSASP